MSFQQMIINTIVIFIVIYIIARLLGKKLISQMTFFDFVAGVSLGSMVGSAIFTPDIPVWMGIISLVLFAAITFVLDITSLKSLKGRKILNDEPAVLIREGEIFEEGMRKGRLTVNDLLLLLRKKDIFYLDEVEFAIFETDGTISALKKAANQTPTASDFQISSISRGLPKTFIMDGNILPDCLSTMGKDEKWVREILQQHNIAKIENVSVAQIDQQNKVYISRR
ncbi:MAG: DUF421 domain-containing protein [Bacillota bacterium]|nr:DUF421 domain-containing protein [Bacillota bacterium]